ncbi:hypothetical protein [Yinghuangia seranimata]|uniref:hypothetical protein n=1 Tax=Yinghuangia seranimata TaxID=408067 RepID=UPI00248B4FEC|nr:hypothetical protein [Yinghuangia seranimata]MDI2126028.1 hypothetical protein [Yinghuangia seranimata]
MDSEIRFREQLNRELEAVEVPLPAGVAARAANGGWRRRSRRVWLQTASGAGVLAVVAASAVMVSTLGAAGSAQSVHSGSGAGVPTVPPSSGTPAASPISGAPTPPPISGAVQPPGRPTTPVANPLADQSFTLLGQLLPSTGTTSRMGALGYTAEDVVARLSWDTGNGIVEVEANVRKRDLFECPTPTGSWTKEADTVTCSVLADGTQIAVSSFKAASGLRLDGVAVKYGSAVVTVNYANGRLDVDSSPTRTTLPLAPQQALDIARDSGWQPIAQAVASR